MTLGCGGYGGNITSDNISPRHLLNIKRLAYEIIAGEPLARRRRADRSAAAEGRRGPRCHAGVSRPARSPSGSMSSSRRAAMSCREPVPPARSRREPPAGGPRHRSPDQRSRLPRSRSRSPWTSCAKTMCGRRCDKVASSSSAKGRSSRRPLGILASSITCSSLAEWPR